MRLLMYVQLFDYLLKLELGAMELGCFGFIMV